MNGADLTNVPILVVSCDLYADLWAPFFAIFFQRWPQCPYRVFLGTNHKNFEDERVISIPIGNDLSWANGLEKMLLQLDSEYVIIFLEDFLIRKPVNTERIQKLVKFAMERKAGCLRLMAGLPLALAPSQPVEGIDGVGAIHKSEAYRVSAQVALWDTRTLKKLLIPGMSAWEFEEIGTFLSEEIDDLFLGVYEPAIEYSQCVEKGKWKPEGIEICREAGVAIDFKVREAFSVEELEQYYSLATKKNRLRNQMQSGSNSFRDGKIIEGLKAMGMLILTAPLDITLWGVLLTGLNPSLFRIFRQHRLKHRLNKIRDRLNQKIING